MDTLFSKITKKILRDPIPEGIIDWSKEPTYDLWFEQADAKTRLPAVADRWQLTATEQELLTKWVDDGYFTISNVIDPEDLDRFASEVDSAWFAPKPIENLNISGVELNGRSLTHIAHSQLLALPEEERIKVKDESNWRIGEFHLFNQSARKIFDNPHIARMCSAIFDRTAYPHFSLTFSKGSKQLLHQDTCVFHTWPMNALIGVWIALEDIHADSGPLVYYPGSHREPLYFEFDNYPQTQRRTASEDQSDRYQKYVEDTASKYERREFIAKKGDVLLWHGMLVHGGASFVAPNTSRKSFVIHYLPDGGNVGHRVKGPFNW